MTGAKKFHDELYLIDYVAVKCHGKSQRAPITIIPAIPGQFFFLYKQYDKFFFRRRFYGFVTLLE